MKMNDWCLGLVVSWLAVGGAALAAADRPNVVLVMADDQGWGQTGYYDHPVLNYFFIRTTRFASASASLEEWVMWRAVRCSDSMMERMRARIS